MRLPPAKCLQAEAEADDREFGLLSLCTVESLTGKGLDPVSCPYLSRFCSCRSRWLEYERGLFGTGLGEGTTLPTSCLEGISHHRHLGKEGKKPWM